MVRFLAAGHCLLTRQIALPRLTSTFFTNYVPILVADQIAALEPSFFDMARPPPGSLELWPPVVARRRTGAWCLGWEPLAAIPLVVAHSLAAAALPFVFWVAAAL